MQAIITFVGNNVNKLANLFSAYNPNTEVEYDFSDSDLGEPSKYYDVATKRDLPIQGKSNLIYRTLDDLSLWSWKRNAYMEYNPYAFGLTQEYNEVVPEVIVVSNVAVLDVNNVPLVLQDVQQLPSIGIDAVREGADARLALGYNIEALRMDLRTISSLKITFESMVSDKKDRPYFKAVPKQNTLDNWFYQNHTALHTLLRSSCRSSTHLDKNMLDGINLKGAHLWWDEKTNNAKFKDGEFEVNL